MGHEMVRDWISEHENCCDQQRDVHGVCAPLAKGLGDRRAPIDSQFWHRFTSGLARLWAISKDCRAVQEMLTTMACQITLSIDAVIHDIEGEGDASKFRLLTGSKRKLRVVEDYKEEDGQKKIHDKKVHSGAQLARASGDVDDATARKWGTMHTMSCRAACMDQMTSEGVAWLVSNGSRMASLLRRPMFLTSTTRQSIARRPSHHR